MAYTPELNEIYSARLRRIAWGTGRPMTVTLEEIIDYVCEQIEPQGVCEKCRDKSLCEHCIFKGGNNVPIRRSTN